MYKSKTHGKSNQTETPNTKQKSVLMWIHRALTCYIQVLPYEDCYVEGKNLGLGYETI